MVQIWYCQDLIGFEIFQEIKAVLDVIMQMNVTMGRLKSRSVGLISLH